MSERQKPFSEHPLHLSVKGVGSRSDRSFIDQGADGHIHLGHASSQLYSIHPDFNAESIGVDVDLVDGWLHEYRIRLNPYCYHEKITGVRFYCSATSGLNTIVDGRGGCWNWDSTSKRPTMKPQEDGLLPTGTVASDDGNLVFECQSSRWVLTDRNNEAPRRFRDLQYRTRAKLLLAGRDHATGCSYKLIRPEAEYPSTHSANGLMPGEYFVSQDNNIPDLRVCVDLSGQKNTIAQIRFIFAVTHVDSDDLERDSAVEDVQLLIASVSDDLLTDSAGGVWRLYEQPDDDTGIDRFVVGNVLHGAVHNGSGMVYLTEHVPGRSTELEYPVWSLD